MCVIIWRHSFRLRKGKGNNSIFYVWFSLVIFNIADKIFLINKASFFLPESRYNANPTYIIITCNYSILCYTFIF